ncbi:MAG: alanine--glyoxylate aminotransferase family protein [Negativicutes bacterium]|nr:alanine--glyoxylate aminotransferase family protein [Negativicutes bacterium]
MDKMILTPGPVEVAEPVRFAMAKPILNPDLDLDFFDFYENLCGKLKKLLHTQNDVLVLNGEGILGLEAAVVNLVQPGETVLVLDNGFFGRGFADFVTGCGGKVVFLSKDYNEAITAEEIRQALIEHPEIKVATMVHCDTPSGMLNPVGELARVCRERGVISVVDAVASMAGEKIELDDWQIDIVIGGSQKALSAPPGLTILAISQQAWQKMLEREIPYGGYYLNLVTWKNGWLAGTKEFPYTMPISDLYALEEAVNRALAEGEGLYARHRMVASAVRETLSRAGFQLMPRQDCRAVTVTAIMVPLGIDDERFRRQLWKKYGVMIGGSWGSLAGKVWRIGHMGEGARPEKLFRFFDAFEKNLRDFKREPYPMAAVFAELYQESEI